MRPRLHDDRGALGQASIEDNRIAMGSADRRHGADLELGVVSREIGLAREMHVFGVAASELAQLAKIDPLRGGQHRADVARRRRVDTETRHPSCEEGGHLTAP